MGLTDLVSEVTGVFDFLASVYSVLPVAIQILILGSFGGVLYICVLRSIWR